MNVRFKNRRGKKKVHFSKAQTFLFRVRHLCDKFFTRDDLETRGCYSKILHFQTRASASENQSENLSATGNLTLRTVHDIMGIVTTLELSKVAQRTAARAETRCKGYCNGCLQRKKRGLVLCQYNFQTYQMDFVQGN